MGWTAIQPSILRNAGILMKVLGVILNAVSGFVERLSMWPSFVAILAMVVMVFVSVFSRYFGKPLQPVEEYTGYLAAVITMFSLAYILKRSSHISVDFIPQLLGPKQRTRQSRQNNDQPSHCRRIGLCLGQLIEGLVMKLRPVADLFAHQPANDLRTQQDRY